MAFTAANGLSEWLAAPKQDIPFVKTASRTTVALTQFSIFDLAGQPGAGTLAGTSTSAGVEVVADTNGTPRISPFNTAPGTKGYLSRVTYSNSVIGNLQLYDLIFKAGAYAFTAATTTLTGQPVISDRCPDYPGSGSDFGVGNEIWIEVSTAFVTGTAWQVRVTYTNSAGVTGRSTIISVAQNAAALTLGKMFQLALQAGDSGVQTIESVVVTNGGTAMTAGAFNVLILRKLWEGRIPIANTVTTDDMLKTGMPIVYEASAIIATVKADGTSSGLPNINLQICNA